MRVMDVIYVLKIVLLSQNGLVHEESSRSQTHAFGEREREKPDELNWI